MSEGRESKAPNLFAMRARKQRLEKELKELYSTRHSMERLAAAGSVADQKNLGFIQSGIDKGLAELKDLEGKLAGR